VWEADVRSDTEQTRPKGEPPHGGSARLWTHRLLAAVAIPAAFLLGLEGALRIAGYGRTVRFLVPDDRAGYLRTNPDFVASFLPSAFDLRPLNYRVSERKPANALRVVVLGESAAQGIPVPAFAFAAQLRAQLRARYPGRDIEVINTGIVAINSHVVYQIAREMAGYSPDLFVIYMGNNEVVGPYGPGCAYLSRMPPLWLIRLSVFVRSTRTGQLAAQALGAPGLGAGRQEEWGGMSMFVNNAVAGDDPRLEAVYRNFEANLRDIVRIARGAGARTLLCTVVSNVKDCAPFLSLHRAGITESETKAWDRSFNRGRIEWLIGDAPAARADLLEALRIDPQYADTEFLLGSLDLKEGDVQAARAHFIGAEHWDALRFRPDPRINEIIREVAGEGGQGVSLVDAAMALGSDPASSAAPAGSGLLFEHVHLDWEGNYRLALMAAQAAEAALPPASDGARAWLDSRGCADALAYTPHERCAILQKVGSIVDNPPFTNQLTYCEDEARLAHELSAARAERSDPGGLRRSLQAVQTAMALDPGSADLPKMAEEILDDMGDVPGALAQARRAGDLQPWNYALAADEAIKLCRLGSFGEAESLLDRASARSTARDQAAMAPAFADLYTRTRRFDGGRRYLGELIRRRPADQSLKLLLGRLEQYSGDTAGAEREYRAVLEADPANVPAAEELQGLLGRAGRASEAEAQCLEVARLQPRNLTNNLRAAVIYDERHDAAQEVRCLLAAERSGPVTSGVEINLARKLMELNRPDDALAHLAEARRISAFEGNPAATAAIGQAIEAVLSRLR
jgi:tetratricopeptide (TPR) repeat protein